ncbi:hypothetical protein DVR09_16405 (plasmid) [Erythrobacter aureus]|uniref:Uncharacterized protein n=1 Tax=Erythrobacter aureus TaxID=2182384 RepID=A0A345YJD2_9SPHN|nr:hypothetical protein DVR09_16405 [Erythrobacter aureus]
MMLEPVDLDAWAAQKKDMFRGGETKRTGEIPTDDWVNDRYQGHLGVCLEAAIEHLPADERPLYVEVGSWRPKNARDLYLKAVSDGDKPERTSVQGLIVVTRRRVLGIEQYSGRLTRFDNPPFREGAINLVTHLEKLHGPNGPNGIAISFGKKEVEVDASTIEDVDRLFKVLCELTGSA